MNDPDPAIAANLGDLAACLRHAHLLADKPLTGHLSSRPHVRAGSCLAPG